MSFIRFQFTYRYLALAAALALALAACGGGGSGAPASTPNPIPRLTSISPFAAVAGGQSFTLTASGSNFTSGSVIRWGGSSRITTFVNSTALTATITSADIQGGAVVPVTVFNPSPGGGGSTSLPFIVENPVPAIASVSPSHVVYEGPAFTLTVNGTNFVPSSEVNFNGGHRPTTFVNPTQLTAAISAEAISILSYPYSGWAVEVWNPSPGGGESNRLEVTFEWPVPVMRSVFPPSAFAGGSDLVLEIYASKLGEGTTLRWNGSDRPTWWSSPYGFHAMIPSSDIGSPGVTTLTLFTPPPGGGESAPLDFPVVEPAPLEITTSRLPDTSVGKVWELRLAATGGIPQVSYPDLPGEPYSWQVVSGALPSGLTLLYYGRILGTVTGPGTPFTVSVTDSAVAPNVSTRDFTVNVRPLGRNDSLAAATQISNGTIRSSISPYGDEDFYAFQATAGATVVAEIFAQRGSPSQLDTAMEIVDSSGNRPNTCRSPDHPRDPNDPYNFTILDLTPDAFDDPCACDDIELGVVRDSLLEFRPATSGTYYIHVVDLRGDGRPEFVYDLSLSGAD